MSDSDKNDRYSKDETEQRMRAALKGARLVGHKPMKPVKPKKAKKKAR
jgi:hypothetical protein